MSREDHSVDQPLAIFGGTFDPVHYGHLRLAEEARAKLNLANMYLLPAGTPPHRSTPFTTAAQRLDMLRLAIAEFPSLSIDDREMRREGPSYMVETLKELRAEFPHRPLLLLVGQDAANYLHTWHEWEQIFTLAHLVTFPRPGEEKRYRQDLARQIERRSCSNLQSLLENSVGGVLHLELELIDISATSIQSIIRLGRSPRSMLPDPVLDYINKKQLYSAA
jgi:nicotinate-nucleotide adenylyltransferase